MVNECLFGGAYFPVFRIGLDVGWVMDFPDFELGIVVTICGVDRDKDVGQFTALVKADSEAVPTDGGKVVGIFEAVVFTVIENNTTVAGINFGCFVSSAMRFKVYQIRQLQKFSVFQICR